MNIAVDAMGGDWAPMEVVKGAIQAAKTTDVNILLVGNPEEIVALEPDIDNYAPALQIVAASDKVEMTDKPAFALRHKRESSLAVAASLVRDGDASALVSAGNTGATMAFSLRNFGRLPGVNRPGIAIPLPTASGFCILIDGGANLTVKPQYLLQFAQMGSLYVQCVHGRNNPVVALLNVGPEPDKGTPLLQEAYELLNGSELNFKGNIESSDILSGAADVVVTDGLSGNLLLKFAEGLGSSLMDMLKSEIEHSGLGVKIGALLTRPVLKALKKRMDPDEYGGALLLGLKHPTVICHGSSQAPAIFNGIRVAQDALFQNITGKITALLQTQPEESREQQ
ncbi:MAG TPA: phosphate acyltransferase PlsX [bacterium]|jgi:glycerol-3-phosphate acyltransferase PlsX|nr:phosphate acyltransferase PlsX [bacterium]